MTHVMMDVIEEHLGEAGWLWGMREQAVVAPDHDLSDTSELEERLLAHVDGLVEGGPCIADGTLRPALGEEDLELVCVAALALLQTDIAPENVRSLLCEVGPAQRPSVLRALELSTRTGLDDILLPLLHHGAADIQPLVLEALVFREEAPFEDLTRYLTHESAQLRRIALRGLSHPTSPTKHHMGRQMLTAALPADPHEADIDVGLTIGDRRAWATCQKRLHDKLAPPGRETMVLAAIGGGDVETAAIVDLLHPPKTRAGALWALGFSGRPLAADACLPWLGDSAVAKLAGEAFSNITGLKLEGPYVLPSTQPRQEPLPLEEEDLDADIAPRPEDDLPLPHPEAIASWWHSERHRFADGARYLLGHPFQGEVLWTALARGPMRRRHEWARELVIRSGGTLNIPTRALAHRQRAALQQTRSRVANLPTGPFSRLNFD
ncbi:TIGR02270 family protein [Myxococcus sp. AB036A]|uniref:TIGR02270 family protein n=1 Tax=Myxococcus sp. AB036A TaxID=2562793 RepID=UPI0018914700|nr:TIGR02270 family protein [Myxococcus sp. AB036A]